MIRLVKDSWGGFTRKDIQEIVHAESELLQREMGIIEERLRGEIHRNGRQQLLAFVGIMTLLNGTFAGVLSIALT